MYEFPLDTAKKTLAAAQTAGLRAQDYYFSNAKESAEEVLEREARTLKLITPKLILLNLFGLWLTMVAFYGQDASTILFAWSNCIGLILTLWTVSYILIQRPRGTSAKAVDRKLKVHTYLITILGLSWAVMPTLLWELAGHSRQFSLGSILLTMIFGTVLLSGRLRMQALRFSIPLCIGLCVPALMSPSGQSVSILSTMLVFFMTVLASTRWYTKELQTQFDQELTLEKSLEAVSAMLRDFDESTDDIFWETNSQGKVQLAQDPQSLVSTSLGFLTVGSDLVEVFQPSAARDKLVDVMRARHPFRDLEIKRTVPDGSHRWYKMTAKPTADHNKQFAGFRGVAKDITNTKSASLQLDRIEHYDLLTNLPNRAYLTQKLTEWVDQSPTNQTNIKALLLVDLENFKWVIDTLGQDSGDILVQKVARRLQSVLGPSNILARTGGEEFTIMINCESLDGMKSILVDLQQCLNEPTELSGTTAHTKSTIGVRIFPTDPSETCDAGTLMRQAGLALRAAKKHKKGSWKVYLPSMEYEALSHARLESDLREAIAKNALDLMFQPIFDCQTGEIVSVESLARWNHPLKGQISPETFISYAEDRGLIIELGDWILRTALRQGSQLPEDVKISINISPLQLHSAQLISNVVNALAQTGVAAHRLELEITERIFMDDNSFTLKYLQSLKELGVRVALDDFGTGYSSLSYLMKFPFDKLKIDKSFIDDLETKEGNRAITEATLKLAKSLGVRTTAEGVETQFQKTYLTEVGCDELQGYFLGKPMTIDEILSKLSASQNEDVKRAREFSLPKGLKLDWRRRA